MVKNNKIYRGGIEIDDIKMKLIDLATDTAGEIGKAVTDTANKFSEVVDGVGKVTGLDKLKGDITKFFTDLKSKVKSKEERIFLQEIENRILKSGAFDAEAIHKKIDEINTELVNRNIIKNELKNYKGNTTQIKEIYENVKRLKALPRAPAATTAATTAATQKLSPEEKLAYLECYIKRLDLKLKIVDEEIIDDDEIDEVKNSCSSIDDDGFIQDMKNKSANNRLKNILKWFSLICPLIGSINQLSLASLVGKSESAADISGKVTEAIGKSEKYFNDISGFINAYVDASEAMMSIGEGVDTAIDLGILPDNLVNNLSKASQVSAVAVKDSDVAVKGVKSVTGVTGVTGVVSRLFIKSTKVSSLALMKSFEILSKTFCMLMFNFFLFTSALGDTNNGVQDYLAEIIFSTIDTHLITGGGKKGKRTKDPVKALLEFNNKTLRDILNPTKTKTKSARKPRKAAAEPAKKKK